MKSELLKSLKRIGVDTRFVSIIENRIYINNLKLSRFSRRKEEEFSKFYPQIEVLRSKMLQRTCVRASRNLAHCIHPKDRILLRKNKDPLNYALYIILEPYQRKYGIDLIFSEDIKDSAGLSVDSYASALTLDHEVINILNQMIHGEKIELISSIKTRNHKKIIYPLINVPKKWIYSWLRDKFPKFVVQKYETEEFLNFLETIIPDIRENLYKSALFVS
jgi:hypothetical protein